MPRQIFRAPHIALMQLEPCTLHRRREHECARALRGPWSAECARRPVQPARASRRVHRPPRRAAPLRRNLLAADTARRPCRRRATAGPRASARLRASPCVTTARNRPGRRRASAATITAADDPGSPTTVRRCPGAGIVLSSRVNAGRRSIASSRRGSATRTSGCDWAGQAARRSADAAARPGPRCRRVTRLSASTSTRAAPRNRPPSGRPALASYTAATHRLGLASTVTPRPRKRVVNDLSGSRVRSDSRGSGLTTMAPTRAPPRRRK